MKKILLAAAFLAVVSTNSFGGPVCADGTLASLAGVTCTITNAAGSWDLSLFGFTAAGANQFGYSADVTTSNIYVSFTTLSNPNGGGLGFYVDFSNPGGGPNNYFSASSGNPNQSVDWKTTFKVVANNTASNISQVDHEVRGSSTNSNNNGQVYVQKVLRDGNDVYISDQSIQHAQGSGPSPSALVTVIDNENRSQLKITDNYQIASGNNGTSSLTSYRNYFYAADPQTGIPEPMTFVLMGAGLVGVAALRRRKA